MGKCIVIGAGLNIAPARLALINSDVDDGDLIILVGLSGDALGALAEFTSQVYQDLGIKVEQFILNTKASLVDTVAGLRSFIEDYAPCSIVIGIAGDRWVTTVLSFLAMTLATVGGFTGISVDRVFTMPDKGEPVNWPIAPRLINLSQTEYRVLRLICDGHALAKEVTKAYVDAFKEGVSIQVVERVLAKLRVKRLVEARQSGKAYAYEVAQLGKLIACRVPVIRGGV
jgi:hypothetical protein